jgi:6-pyruvoyl-tetrahydropterin synthase
LHRTFSIKVDKQYFNFAAAHFLIFGNDEREPLHGHNYRVSLVAHSTCLKDDMVFDFLDIKPIVRDICNSLDHKVLLPQLNPRVTIQELDNSLIQFSPPKGPPFTFPMEDVLLLPIENTSAERLAIYIGEKIIAAIKNQFSFAFDRIEVSVEETPGQAAIVNLTANHT